MHICTFNRRKLYTSVIWLQLHKLYGTELISFFAIMANLHRKLSHKTRHVISMWVSMPLLNILLLFTSKIIMLWVCVNMFLILVGNPNFVFIRNSYFFAPRWSKRSVISLNCGCCHFRVSFMCRKSYCKKFSFLSVVLCYHNLRFFKNLTK